jgi:hypothetical protein
VTGDCSVSLGEGSVQRVKVRGDCAVSEGER